MLRPLASRAPVRGATSVLASLLESRTGQRIAADRAWVIETALNPILRDRELDSLDALVAEVLGGRDPLLADHVVDALLNQESSFFRDAAVLAMVGDAVAALQEESGGRRLRLWSAGCSTGQEPLSLAMLCAARAAGIPPEIVATDVSRAAVARARAARYSQFEIQRGLPVREMVRWFDTIDKEWVAKPELVRQISFRQMNLVADPLPIGQFDIVLCRNVLIYLSPALRRRVLDRIAPAVRPGGLLVLGAGETISGQTDAFRPSLRFRGMYEPTGVRGEAAATG